MSRACVTCGKTFKRSPAYTAIGMVKENVGVLRRAAYYLEERGIA